MSTASLSCVVCVLYIDKRKRKTGYESLTESVTGMCITYSDKRHTNPSTHMSWCRMNTDTVCPPSRLCSTFLFKKMHAHTPDTCTQDCAWVHQTRTCKRVYKIRADILGSYNPQLKMYIAFGSLISCHVYVHSLALTHAHVSHTHNHPHT